MSLSKIFWKANLGQTTFSLQRFQKLIIKTKLQYHHCSTNMYSFITIWRLLQWHFKKNFPFITNWALLNKLSHGKCILNDKNLALHQYQQCWLYVKQKFFYMIKLSPPKKNEDLSLKTKWLESIMGKRRSYS